jgi:tetratricopeptide (TPR) repeat protein
LEEWTFHNPRGPQLQGRTVSSSSLRCIATAALVALGLAPVPSVAQESDTVILEGNRSTYTILSDVNDPAERELFTGLYNTPQPAMRYQFAQRFLSTYPQSWLLAQVYDVAARASLDLGNIPQALEEARFSLRLLPENPTLLVLVANAEAQTQDFEHAIGDARDALEYLEQFTAPGAYSEQEWSGVKLQLKASSYFALGRAQFAKALRQQTGVARDILFPQARDALEHAAAFNQADPEIFYLRALVELKMNDKEKALRDFAFVARSSNALQNQAAANFRRLSNTEPSSQSSPKIDETLRADLTSSKPTAAIREGYAGSQACQTCHSREYQTWLQTGMARMLRPYDPQNIMGKFSSVAAFKDESSETVIRMGVDVKHYFEILDKDGVWRRFSVDYTIGSKWQQAYATQLADGSLQVIPIQYNTLKRKWVNYWKIIDPPGSKRDVITDFPSLQTSTNYEVNCAICHTSQLRAASGGASPMEHAKFREPGVDCEMCHGPAAWHVERMRSGKLAKVNLLEPPVDFRRIDNRSGVQVCAQCHRQSAVRKIDGALELNYSSTTSSYVLPSWSMPYDAFSRLAFYKDGRFRETTFIVEAFTRSACYRRGTAQCASCHSPHSLDFKHNPTSLKYGHDSDEMCLACHTQFRNHIPAHTHHAANTEASLCVSCHMPRIVNALLFQARSHEIEIPRADLTERFGQNDSPNTCLLCHKDRDANWTASKLKRWRD